MPAQTDRDVAERVMGWTLSGNRWIDGDGQDTGFRTTTWKPSEDKMTARIVLKRLVASNRTARTEETDTEARAVLFDENIQLIENLPVNVGAELRRAVAGTYPAAVCSLALG